ncbi:MAG: hypothetical protein MJZ09_03710 [Bacteroidales bacterium]|nr:hypothetical protein [Bacteroidales bacterium]
MKRIFFILICAVLVAGCDKYLSPADIHFLVQNSMNCEKSISYIFEGEYVSRNDDAEDLHTESISINSSTTIDANASSELLVLTNPKFYLGGDYKTDFFIFLSKATISIHDSEISYDLQQIKDASKCIVSEPINGKKRVDIIFIL